MIKELRVKYKLAELLKLANISRSTYYYNIKQNKKPKYTEEKVLIEEIFYKNKCRRGHRIIAIEVRKIYKINKKTVLKLMNEMGLHCVVRKRNKYKSYKGTIGKVAPNILYGNFRSVSPTSKLVTDVTEFKVLGNKFYLSPVLDLCTKEILSYNISEAPTFDLVRGMLEDLVNKLPKGSSRIMHSDQGWHYQMKPYQRLLKENGIVQSMSRKGNCLDNAAMESFFAILKTELLTTETFSTKEDFINKLHEYIYYYNNVRIKEQLKGMSPVEYRNSLLI